MVSSIQNIHGKGFPTLLQKGDGFQQLPQNLFRKMGHGEASKQGICVTPVEIYLKENQF